MSQARLLGHTRRPDGNSDTFWAASVPCMERLTFQPKAPRRRTPSRYVVLFNGRWWRVYLDLRTPTVNRAYIGEGLPEVGEHIRVDYLPGA